MCVYVVYVGPVSSPFMTWLFGLANHRCVSDAGWALDDSKLVVCLHHVPSSDYLSQFCLRPLAQLPEMKQRCKGTRLIF